MCSYQNIRQNCTCLYVSMYKRGDRATHARIPVRCSCTQGWINFWVLAMWLTVNKVTLYISYSWCIILLAACFSDNCLGGVREWGTIQIRLSWILVQIVDPRNNFHWYIYCAIQMYIIIQNHSNYVIQNWKDCGAEWKYLVTVHPSLTYLVSHFMATSGDSTPQSLVLRWPCVVDKALKSKN